MAEEVPDQGFPTHAHTRRPGKRSLPWRQDGEIRQRMAIVQRKHFEGWPHTRIAAFLGVDEWTVRLDLKRLAEDWKDRTDADADVLRAQHAAELADVQQRALEAAVLDQRLTRAVLFGEPFEDDDGTEYRVYRDEKGRAEYRGQAAQHLDTARKAIVDRAKVLGLVIDKAEVSGEGLVRIYERGTRSEAEQPGQAEG